MNYKRLDKRSPVPLYYQLVEWIRGEIAAGALLVGSQLPSERELSERMGVSRMTLRQAITYLIIDGVLVAQQGVGTFVAEAKLTHNALNLLGFTEEMMRQGGSVTSRVLEQDVICPPQKVAAMLNLSTREQAVKIVRLRHVDHVPLLLETSFVPLACCPGLQHEELETKSLYTLLEQEYGLRFQRSSQTIESTVVNEYERSLFNVEPNTAMLLLEGVTYTGHDRPMEYFKALYRGDRFKFIIDSQRGDDNHGDPSPPHVSVIFSADDGRRTGGGVNTP